jgi:hypothetical protein
MKSPFKRKTTTEDMVVMLKVFRGCIDTMVLPSKGSPCYKLIKKIISDYKKRKRK